MFFCFCILGSQPYQQCGCFIFFFIYGKDLQRCHILLLHLFDASRLPLPYWNHLHSSSCWNFKGLTYLQDPINTQRITNHRDFSFKDWNNSPCCPYSPLIWHFCHEYLLSPMLMCLEQRVGSLPHFQAPSSFLLRHYMQNCHGQHILFSKSTSVKGLKLLCFFTM